ncbi:MAG: hypothetical protein VX278_21090, partial [Myxococcota bacterium]|nr:hypothetical protein [Myxococcota bacterium]
YAYTSRSTLYLSNGQTWAPANDSPLLGVYSIGDLNQDNRTDFLVGTEQESYLFFGSSNLTANPISLPYQAHDASAITGSSENIAIVDTDRFYFHGTSPWNVESSTPLAKTVLTHDVNGDGIDEIFFSSPQARLNQGEVYVLFDHAPLSSVDDITGIIVGEEFTGAAIEALPDINNDGYNDIAIGAPLHNNAAGTVYLFTKILDIEQPVENAPFRLFGTQENERAGSDIAVSDFDMDGYVDFAISAPRYSDTSSEDGIVYLVPGEFLEASQGSFDLYGNAQHIRSPYASAHLGEQVEFLNEELLVSAPNLSIHAPDAGALYHFTLPILGATSFTLDEDADGFGRQLNPYIGCYRQANHIADQTDCNDNNPSSSPISPETCQDGEDNNCNLLIDNADCACSNNCVERCTDNIDNDLDSLTDCDDLDCAGTSTCGTSVIYDTGIATRIFLPGFAEPCLDSSCWENVQERCSLEIAAEGEIRIPIGANSYEKCSFTEESVYRNERESPFEDLIGCSLLPLYSRDLTIDESCSVQDDSLFPTEMEADRFGFPDNMHFNNDAWYPLYAVDYSYSNGYLWTAAIKTRYAK